MRGILFRAKREDNNEWIYGGYVFLRDACDEKYNFIGIHNGWGTYKVLPETVCEFTGLTDKNGNIIFEGDILKWDSREWGGEYNEIVHWDYELFNMRENDWKEWCEIIGNIYDNPKLLTY